MFGSEKSNVRQAETSNVSAGWRFLADVFPADAFPLGGCFLVPMMFHVPLNSRSNDMCWFDFVPCVSHVLVLICIVFLSNFIWVQCNL